MSILFLLCLSDLSLFSELFFVELGLGFTSVHQSDMLLISFLSVERSKPNKIRKGQQTHENRICVSAAK